MPRYQFTGQEHDPETEYDYFGYRYYNRELGRFLSIDPMTSERIGLSPYNYVQNNPINRIDPTGALDDKVDRIFIDATKLESIAVLKALSNNLTEIQIQQCKKIKDFEILGELKFLRKIILSESGEITSLAFMEKLPLLEFISFWGTNVLDGNIIYCEGIKYVGFDNKKHYSHKVEQFNNSK